MNKYQEFLNYLEELEDLAVNIRISTRTSGIEEVYQEIKTLAEKELNKPLFTESGLAILEYLQTVDTDKRMRAVEIGSAMNLSSRKISGAIRKLVTDGYVGKIGQVGSPVSYYLTDKGKEFNIKDYKEKINNAKNCE